MAFTSVADIFYSDAFGRYFKKASTERSALIQSGIAAPDQAITDACNNCPTGAFLVKLPFWNALNGDDEVLVDGTALTPAKITAGQDVAAVLRRGKAFAIGDIAKTAAGDDPLKALADPIVDYWNRMKQKALFRVLKGVFADNAANDSGDHILDISGEDGNDAVLGRDTITMAAALLGDANYKFTAVAMHSAAETVLRKLDLAASGYKPSENGMPFATYQGKNLLVDDSCGYNAETGVAEIYLFGQGAVALNSVPTEIPLESDRAKLEGTNYVITRESYICHVRGVKFAGGSVSDISAVTNSELQNAANWDRVYDSKDVPVVKLICKIA